MSIDENGTGKSIKNTWKELKDSFLHFKKVMTKKYSLSEYLDELSPYSDKLISELETTDLHYEKGYCSFEYKEDKVILTFVLFFKNNLINDVEMKEMRRYLNKEIFNDIAIRDLKSASKAFEILK